MRVSHKGEGKSEQKLRAWAWLSRTKEPGGTEIENRNFYVELCDKNDEFSLKMMNLLKNDEFVLKKMLYDIFFDQKTPIGGTNWGAD